MTNRLAPWLLAFAPLTTLAAAPAAKPPDLAIEAYRLPNGLKVVLHRDPAVPRVSVCVAYHVGSKDERAGRTGFAHFFEHMMFRGTRNVPNYDIPLQEAGASSNAFTTEDMTVYIETVPSPYLERALYLEAERLGFLPSALDRAKFDTEREVVKNERRQSYENMPYGLAAETILANLFPKGHPYSWSVIGSMGDLDRATLDDLKRFFAEFYHPGNAALCLAGEFDPAVARALIARYFGPLSPGTAPKAVAAPAVPPGSRSVTLADRVQLPRVYWAWPAVADDHPDAPALDVLASILAGGEASRLHRALVLDARVATGVGADDDAKEIAGLFTVEATAAEGKTLAEVSGVLDAEIERVRSEPPSATELARVLAKYEKSTLLALTSPLSRAITLATGFVQRGDPADYRRDYARHVAVTAADVRRVARKYLSPAKVILNVEPIEAGKAKGEAVTAGPLPGTADVPQVAGRTPPDGGPDWSKMPGPSAPRAFVAPRFARKRLSNGIEVWFAPWHTLPILTAQLILPAGTADDPAEKSGLATLTARLLDKGTKDLSAVVLAEALEALGVTVSTGAGVDHTVVSFGVAARNLSPSLTLIGRMLGEPRFDPEDFERERGLQLADLLQGPDDPSWIARRAFRAVLYGPKHPYGNPSEGYTDSVKALSVADVRAFHEQELAADHAILVVVGDAEPDALFATLESTLGGWKTTMADPRPRPQPEVKAEPGVLYLVDKPGAVQSVVSVGRRWEEDRKGPHYVATLVGNRILGNDFLSRLNQNLRERNGYTYGAGSAFSYRRTGSVWAVQTSVRADATAPALKEILAELDALAGDRPFTATEIAVARDGEAQSFPENFENPSGIAGIIQEIATHSLPLDDSDTFLDRLRSTTSEAVQGAMAAVVAPAERTVLVVGDRRAIEPKLRALGFREIRDVTPDGLPAPR